MASNYREDIKTTLDKLLLDIPGVQAGKAFGYPSYSIKGKVFAFVGGDGIAVKLPAARVQAIIAAHDDASPFEPAAGRVWKEWVSIDHADAAAYMDDVALLEESVAFVGG